MGNTRADQILLVEDEANLGSTLVERLTQEGYEVVWSKTAGEARNAILSSRFDLALMDIGLPDGNGFEVAELLRKQDPKTSIVFLTAYGNPEDRIRGLELGAEDYVVKPYHFRELLLRLKNGLKRARFASSALLHGTDSDGGVQIGRARVFFLKFELVIDNVKTPLSHKECALLRLLHERRGQVVSRDEILNKIWSEDEFPTTRTVDNFILRLRKLVEPNPEDNFMIRSIRGVGYQLAEEP